MPDGTWFCPEKDAMPTTPTTPSTIPVTELASTGPKVRRGQDVPVRRVRITELMGFEGTRGIGFQGDVGKREKEGGLRCAFPLLPPSVR